MEDADKIVHELKEIQFMMKNGGTFSQTGSGNTTDSFKSFDKSTDKIVAAINMLNVAITSNTKSSHQQKINFEKVNKDLDKHIKQREEAFKKQEELDRETRKLTEENNKTREDALKKTKRDLREQIEAEKQIRSSSQAQWEAFKNSADASDILRTKFYDLAGDSKIVQVGLRATSTMLDGLKNATLSYTKSIYAGERGNLTLAKSTSEVVKSFADVVGTVATFASFLMPGGWLVKGLTFLVGQGLKKTIELSAEMNEKAAEQSDKLFKTFTELSKAGINTTGGLDGIFNQLQTLGMTMPQIEQFSQILASNTKHLRVFGGTMEGGAKQFATVAGQLYKSDIGKQFERAGIAAEEQADMTMNYRKRTLKI
jgi:hypothetical protein